MRMKSAYGQRSAVLIRLILAVALSTPAISIATAIEDEGSLDAYCRDVSRVPSIALKGDPRTWGLLYSTWGMSNLAEKSELSEGAEFGLMVTLHKGTYDPGSMISRGLPVGGSGFAVRLPASRGRCAILSYRVRFPDDFDFVRGGKLPGLAGGLSLHGQRIPRGKSGFAARLMWREHGAGEIYVYNADTPRTEGTFGTSAGRGSWHFTPGKWHSVRQIILLNGIGKTDGGMWMIFDGRQVYSSGPVRMVDDERAFIDGAIFEIFFGGNDSSWATPRTVTIDLDGFGLRVFQSAAER
jgi:hypothetical protein